LTKSELSVWRCPLQTSPGIKVSSPYKKAGLLTNQRVESPDGAFIIALLLKKEGALKVLKIIAIAMIPNFSLELLL
jgi:hypothetical protein